MSFEIEGYSLPRILLFGLIFPAMVVATMLLSFYISLQLGFGLLLTAVVVLVSSMAGFAWGTFVILRLSSQIMRFAKVKEKC